MGKQYGTGIKQHKRHHQLPATARKHAFRICPRIETSYLIKAYEIIIVPDVAFMVGSGSAHDH
jgi:hypothetical protein